MIEAEECLHDNILIYISDWVGVRCEDCGIGGDIYPCAVCETKGYVWSKYWDGENLELPYLGDYPPFPLISVQN